MSDASSFKLVVYNILKGGTGRADPLAEVILAQRADVVVLVDAVDSEVTRRISRRLGMDEIAAAGRCGGGVVVMSRRPILATINHSRLPRRPPADSAGGPGWGGDRGGTLLEARIGLPGGVGEVRVFAVQVGLVRPEDAAGILAMMGGARAAGVPHVVAGNLGGADAEVTAAGYDDALPTAINFPTQRPILRADNILCQWLNVDNGWVETDRLATYASDHYPVGAQLRLNREPR